MAPSNGDCGMYGDSSSNAHHQERFTVPARLALCIRTASEELSELMYSVGDIGRLEVAGFRTIDMEDSGGILDYALEADGEVVVSNRRGSMDIHRWTAILNEPCVFFIELPLQPQRTVIETDLQNTR
jgi:hypothetical protein